MTDLTDRIAEVLQTHRWYFVGNLGVPGMPDRKGYRCNCGWVTRDDGGAELADPDAHVAERIEAALTIPDRQFTDDLGRRWEWCGGEPGTWAWRTTATDDRE